MKYSSLALLTLAKNSYAIIDSDYSGPHNLPVLSCLGSYVSPPPYDPFKPSHAFYDCADLNISYCNEHFMVGANSPFTQCSTAYHPSFCVPAPCNVTMCVGNEAQATNCHDIPAGAICENYYMPLERSSSALTASLQCKTAVNSTQCTWNVEAPCTSTKHASCPGMPITDCEDVINSVLCAEYFRLHNGSHASAACSWRNNFCIADWPCSQPISSSKRSKPQMHLRHSLFSRVEFAEAPDLNSSQPQP